jgi:hypothetical protein
MPPKKKTSIIEIAKKKEEISKEKQEDKELKFIEKVNKEWMDRLEKRYQMKELRIYTNFKDRLLKFGLPQEHLDKIPENMFETEVEFIKWWRQYSPLIQGRTESELNKLYNTLMKNARNLLLSYRVREFKSLDSETIPEDIVYHDGVEKFDDTEIYDLNGSEFYIQEFEFNKPIETVKEKTEITIPYDFINSVDNMIATMTSQYVYYISYERLYNMYLELYEKEARQDISMKYNIILDTLYPILDIFDKQTSDKLFLVLFYPERRLDVRYYEKVSQTIKELKQIGESIDYDKIMKDTKSNLYPEFEYGIVDALDYHPELNQLLDVVSIPKLVDILKRVWDYENTEHNKQIMFFDLILLELNKFIFPKEKFIKHLTNNKPIETFSFPKHINIDDFLYFWYKTPSLMPTPEQILYKVLDISYLHPELVNIVFRLKRKYVSEDEQDNENQDDEETTEIDYGETDEIDTEGLNFKDLERYVMEDNTYKHINMVLTSNSRKLLKMFFGMRNEEAYNQMNNYIRIIYSYLNNTEYNITNIYISGLILFIIYFYNDYLIQNLKSDDNYNKIRNHVVNKLRTLNVPGITKTKINVNEIDQILILMTNEHFSETINFNDNGNINKDITVSNLLQVRGKSITYEPIHPDNIFLNLVQNNNINEIKKEFHNLTKYAKFVNHRYVRMVNPEVYQERSKTVNSVLGYNQFTDSHQVLVKYRTLLTEYKTILLQGMKNQDMKEELVAMQNEILRNHQLAIEDFNYVLVYELGIVVDYIKFNPLDKIEMVYTKMYRERKLNK